MVRRYENISYFPSLFCLRVTLFLEKVDDFLLEIALHQYLAVLDTAADAAFCLQEPAKFFHIGLCSYEIPDQGDGLAAAVVLLHAHPQLLLLFWESFIFLLFIGGIGKIRICRIDHIKSIFPIIVLHKFINCKNSRRLRYNIFL